MLVALMQTTMTKLLSQLLNNCVIICVCAGVAELADAYGSGPYGAQLCEGSNPFARTSYGKINYMSAKSDIAKTTASVSRFVLQKILRRPGGFFPGDIALKIDPELLVELSKQFDSGTVLVTGTNGKTSVTNLIADCMRYEGAEVA